MNENGDAVTVDLQIYGNGNEALVSADGLTAYYFDYKTGTLVNPLATGAAESVCPSCYLIGGGSVKFGWGALKSWVTGTLGGPRVGHRLFTETRKNGTWNTGMHRFGWSGKNGSDTYQFMYRYKEHHIPTGIKTTRAHPSGG
ncbi:MAG: hypothetical protein ACTH5C_07285 [Pseudoalteromonas prydzensis]|uniref:hypothetical protein n=1 Tax=Pseudoalteromonas prydzensis TaxID=182141 RepID=UPI003F9CBFC7